MPDAGHNSALDVTQLRSVIDRIEVLEGEKAEISGQIKEVYSEAADNGFCPKTLKRMVSLRKLNAADRQADLFMFDLYADALRMRAGPIVGL